MWLRKTKAWSIFMESRKQQDRKADFSRKVKCLKLFFSKHEKLQMSPYGCNRAYGPNRDSPEFYNIIKSDIERFVNPVILAGDFNLVLDPNMDLLNYRNINKPLARNKVHELISNCNLIDVWRELNAEKSLLLGLDQTRIKEQD